MRERRGFHRAFECKDSIFPVAPHRVLKWGFFLPTVTVSTHHNRFHQPSVSHIRRCCCRVTHRVSSLRQNIIYYFNQYIFSENLTKRACSFLAAAHWYSDTNAQLEAVPSIATVIGGWLLRWGRWGLGVTLEGTMREGAASSASLRREI